MVPHQPPPPRPLEGDEGGQLLRWKHRPLRQELVLGSGTPSSRQNPDFRIDFCVDVNVSENETKSKTMCMKG